MPSAPNLTFTQTVLADVIGGLIVAVVGTAAGLLARHWWRSTRAATAFVLEYFGSDFPPARDLAPILDLKVSKGLPVVVLRATPRDRLEIVQIDVRLVSRHRTPAPPVDKRFAYVAELSVEPRSTDPPVPLKGGTTPDSAGGLALNFSPPYVRSSDLVMWIKVKLAAHEPWHGYLSLDVVTTNKDRRQRGRIPIRIVHSE